MTGNRGAMRILASSGQHASFFLFREAEGCRSVDTDLGVAGEELGSGCEAREGTPNREVEGSFGSHAGIWNGMK